jgi:hypothetical protein
LFQALYDNQEKIPLELLNFSGRELRALSEGPPECLELWNLLRNKKRDQIKKISDIAKISLSLRLICMGVIGDRP